MMQLFMILLLAIRTQAAFNDAGLLDNYDTVTSVCNLNETDAIFIALKAKTTDDRVNAILEGSAKPSVELLLELSLKPSLTL